MVSGCRREPLPDTGDGEIRFSAVSLTVKEEPATKFGTMKEDFSAAFATDEAVVVYGRRNTIRTPLVFSGDTVSWNGTAWRYDNPRYWSWKEEGDYYDFLAFYMPPAYAGSSLILTNSTTAPLAISVYYDVADHQYDLMLAGKRRKSTDESRLSTVPLVFHRMLCAVGVKVKNISTTGDLYLDGYHFVNLISYAKASVTADDDPAFAWSNPSRTGASVGGTTLTSRTKVEKTATYSFITSGGYDLMIPQDHNEHLGTDSYPSLVIQYAISDTAPIVEATVPLKNIPVKGSTALISEWNRAVKYVYEIEMDLDGGVQVELTITPWDEIEAETPGLLIPPDWNAPTP